MNVASLTLRNFPHLQCVKVLSNSLLRNLSDAGGPNEEGMKRYNRWWDAITEQQIRFEDCTGAYFGELPGAVEEAEQEEEEEESEDEEEEKFYSDEEELMPKNPVLREVLEECRAMNDLIAKEREQEMEQKMREQAAMAAFAIGRRNSTYRYSSGFL
jgi:hypothetical protein